MHYVYASAIPDRRGREMVVDMARIAQLERELEEARKELWKDDAERYRVLVREMPEDERKRIIERLTDKKERILFGLEPPEEEKRGAAMRPVSRGDLTCPICGKPGLTKRGLALHTIRMHGVEIGKEEGKAA
jgi:hypothetical protein